MFFSNFTKRSLKFLSDFLFVWLIQKIILGYLKKNLIIPWCLAYRTVTVIYKLKNKTFRNEDIVCDPTFYCLQLVHGGHYQFHCQETCCGLQLNVYLYTGMRTNYEHILLMFSTAIYRYVAPLEVFISVWFNFILSTFL